MLRGRPRIPWKPLLGYGALLGLGMLALQWLDYQRLVRSHAALVWDGLLAAGFLALGLWLGVRLLARREAPARDAGNPQTQADLGISDPVLARLRAGAVLVDTDMAAVFARADGGVRRGEGARRRGARGGGAAGA